MSEPSVDFTQAHKQAGKGKEGEKHEQEELGGKQASQPPDPELHTLSGILPLLQG